MANNIRESTIRFTKKHYIMLALLCFLIISIVMVAPCIYWGKIDGQTDWLYHSSRGEQIYRNLKNGQVFTFIASSTFHHSGVASFLFYPTIYLYPWAALRFVFNPITSFYLWYALITFFAFTVSFLSMRAFSRDYSSALIFSFVYVLNNYRLHLGGFTFGEFCAATFLPLVFLGFYRVIFANNKGSVPAWLILGVGMSLLAYAHILSVIITVEIFAAILIVYCLNGNFHKVFNRDCLKAILKSMGLFILLILPMIVLFAIDYMGKHVSAAYFGISMPMVSSASSIVTNSINNIIGWGTGLLLIMIAFAGWYVIRKNRLYMWIYITGISLLVITTSIFPWGVFRLSPLGVIQFPARYLSYSCLFLSIIATKVIDKIIDELPLHRLLAYIIVGIVCFSAYYNVLENIKTVDGPDITTSVAKSTNMPRTALNKNNYHYQFLYSAVYGETDYYPKLSLTNGKSSTIINQIAYLNGKPKQLISKGKANRIIYKINQRINRIDLPVVCYGHTYVMINGHRASYQESNRGTVNLSNLSKYRNGMTITVGYNPGWLFYIAIIVAIVTWGWILFKLTITSSQTGTLLSSK